MTNTPDPANLTPELAEPESLVEQAGHGNAEAAKYRRALRDTEAERDALRAQVEALQQTALDGYLSGPQLIPLSTRNRSLAAQVAAAERAGNHTEAAELRLRNPEASFDPNADLEPVTFRNTSDIFLLGGLDRAACFNPDGTVNTQVIQEAVGNLYRSRPELFATPKAPPAPGIGNVPEMRELPAGWQDVLNAE
jgi:hypothetical protein